MDYLRSKDVKIQKGKIGISIFVLCIILCLVFPYKTKIITEGDTTKRNLFYVEILNYTMPIVKVNSFDLDDMAESQASIKERVLNFIGININNPTSILGREIAALNGEKEIDKPEAENGETDFNIFKLNEQQIAKNPIEEVGKKQENEELNIPNQVATIYDSKLKKTLNSAKPEIFIYHTHTTESYLSNINQLSEVLSSKKDVCDMDTSKNVVAVGDALKEELESKYGIAVVHDKTVHDALAYTQSYARSGETVDKYLKKYGDFKIVIDIHRDSVESRSANVIKINGENVAKYMFVMAKKNPHFNKNMEVVNKLLAISNKLFPGLARETFYYNTGTRFFNQGKSNNAVLIEVGSHINTTEEAKNSAKYLARIMGEYLNGKN